jgi:hypothetical protein
VKIKRIYPQLIIILLILPGFFLPRSSALGQSTVQLTSVQVGLFPEYDRSGMLVVLNFEISRDTTGLQTLTFQVPSESTSLSMLQRPESGEPSLLDFSSSTTGQWKHVELLTDAQTIQMEYYDPNLLKEEDRRFYEYHWLSIYDAESLKLTVRQPFGASKLQVDPPLETRETGPDNATYYTQDLGPVPAGEMFILNLTYTTDTTNQAYPAQRVEPAASVNDATPGRTPSPLSVIMWLLTVAVAVLVLVSLYYWWFKSNVMEKRDRMVQGVGIMNPEKQAVFCHECGMRSRPGDSYCSNCGTELRREPKNLRG